MKIRYLGPSTSVNVGEFGRHDQGAVVDYPDDVGEELLETSKKQQFERALTEDGEPDTQKDKDFDAADNGSGASRLAEMTAAAAKAVEDGNVTGAGVPTVEAMADILGYDVTATERDAAYDAWKQEIGE